LLTNTGNYSNQVDNIILE